MAGKHVDFRIGDTVVLDGPGSLTITEKQGRRVKVVVNAPPTTKITSIRAEEAGGPAISCPARRRAS